MILLLCIAPFFSSNAQTPRCGFDDRIDAAIKRNPEFLQTLDQQNELVTQAMARHQRSYDSELITIPVVVHVLHTGQKIGGQANISDAQIHSAIDRLNKAFAGSDGYSVPGSGIQFSLARRDPACNPTNGIIRINASGICAGNDCYETKGITELNESVVKSVSRWPAEDYLNIWVVQEIDNNEGKNGIQGFAQFPGGDPALDGVTILYNAFGYEEDVEIPFHLKTTTRLGTVLIHEVGHSLGLFHTFEGDDYNRDGIGDRCPSLTGCGPYNGDCISDTPPHRRSNGTCHVSGTNVCDGGFSNELFVHNFMDYSSQECQYEFTPGQVDRMKATLETLRVGWKYSSGDLAVSASTPATASCIPDTRYVNNNFGLGIIDFQLGNYVQHSGNTKEDGGYVDHWCSLMAVQSAATYDLAINTGDQNAQNVKVYIDYNGDGDFNDGGEEVFSSTKLKRHQGKVKIPASAKRGSAIRVRAIAAYSGFNITSPCFQPYYGQAEDYALVVSDPVSAPVTGNDNLLENNVFKQSLSQSEKVYEVFPNPTSDLIYISNPGKNHIKRVEILDVNGKTVLDNDASQDHGIITFSLVNLSPGIHYIRITDDDSVSIKKINRI